jgi:hypothetical protein
MPFTAQAVREIVADSGPLSRRTYGVGLTRVAASLPHALRCRSHVVRARYLARSQSNDPALRQ